MPKEIKFDTQQFILIMFGFWFASALMVWYAENHNTAINREMYVRTYQYVASARQQIDIHNETMLKCQDGIRKQQEIETLKAKLNDAERALGRKHLALMAGLDWK